MIYLIVIFCCLFFMLLEQTKGVDRVLPYAILGTITSLVIFIGFRYDTGPDYFSYQSIYFDRLQQQDMEPLFRLFIVSFREMNIGYNFFLLFIAALSIFCKYHAIRKYSPYFFLSLLIGLSIVFISDMGQIRFSLAIAILWLSIPFCIERDLIKFLIVVALATLVHQSAIIFLLAYWIFFHRLNFFAILGVWLACYLVSFTYMNSDVVEALSALVANDSVMSKMELYSGNDEFDVRYGVSWFGLTSKVLVMAIIYYSNMDDKKLKHFFIHIYSLGCCLFFLLSFSEILGTRFSLYFLSFEVIMIPLALYYIKDTRLYYLFLSIFVIKGFYQCAMLIYVKYPDMYLPYRNFLFLNN